MFLCLGETHIPGAVERSGENENDVRNNCQLWTMFQRNEKLDSHQYEEWLIHCKCGEQIAWREKKKGDLNNSKWRTARTRGQGTLTLFKRASSVSLMPVTTKTDLHAPTSVPRVPSRSPSPLTSTSVLRCPRDERLRLPVPVERSPSCSESPASGLIESAPVVELMPCWLLSVFEIKSLSHWMISWSLQSNNPFKTVQGFRLRI